jgi:hypothetical protein
MHMTDTQRALDAEAKLTDLAHKHEAALRTLDDVDDALKYIAYHLPWQEEFDDMRASAEYARADIKTVLEGFNPLPTQAEIERDIYRARLDFVRIAAGTGWTAAIGFGVALTFLMGGN